MKEVVFSLTLDDLVAAERYHSIQHGRRSRWTLYFYLFLLGCVVYSMIADAVEGRLDLNKYVRVTLFFAVLASLYFLLRGPLTGWLMRRRLTSKDAERLFAEQRLAISPEGVSRSDRHSAGLTAWSGIDRIEVSDAYAFFYLATNVGFCLPKRAFATTEEFGEFIEEAERYRKAAAIDS
jgi:hypothetical protein